MRSSDPDGRTAGKRVEQGGTKRGRKEKPQKETWNLEEK